ncbi:hypothetical protein B2J93_43 [Marssonina coronariae]|uniref:Uncharacterized protein n=1 Tax=Diplocarpon coronariae TaxID=2795749 RepID=A0A218Z350_9HELO|nr:hypothetical protein B2J93_43 [Marssonina coronariae]
MRSYTTAVRWRGDEYSDRKTTKPKRGMEARVEGYLGGVGGKEAENPDTNAGDGVALQREPEDREARQSGLDGRLLYTAAPKQREAGDGGGNRAPGTFVYSLIDAGAQLVHSSPWALKRTR